MASGAQARGLRNLHPSPSPSAADSTVSARTHHKDERNMNAGTQMPSSSPEVVHEHDIARAGDGSNSNPHSVRRFLSLTTALATQRSRGRSLIIVGTLSTAAGNS
eukprot:6621570-Pyramimonas_sp.AAC.1